MGYDRDDPNVQVTFLPRGGMALGGVNSDSFMRTLEDILASSVGGAPTHQPHLVPAPTLTDGGYAETQPALRASLDYERRCEDAALAAGDAGKSDVVTDAVTRKYSEGRARLEATREPAFAILLDVMKELMRAIMKHGPQKSPHEGYAVLLEEVEELVDEIRKGSKHDRAVQNAYSRIRQKVANLWREVKRDGGGRGPEARAEAIQVAAMAIRYVLDNIDAPAEA